MTSVIRVKRKIDCDPAEALLLARKKMKSDYDTEDISSTIAVVIKIEEKVFHYAATVAPEVAHSQQVVADRVKDAIQHRNQQKALMRASLRKRKLPGFISSPCPYLPKIKHLKNATIAACQSVFREKCLNFVSDVKTDSNPEKQFLGSSKTRIEDCEKCSIYHNDDHIPRLSNQRESMNDIMCNNVKMIRENLNISPIPHKTKTDDDFVYDLYYCRNTAANWDMSELLYVQPYRYTEEDLIDASDSEEEVVCDDEDDSNDEGNWRNDYPDDDDDSSGSSSSSEDNWERFVQQEEEEADEEDDVDANADDDDFGQLGQEDTAQYDCNDDAIAEAFDAYDPGDDGGAGGGDDI